MPARQVMIVDDDPVVLDAMQRLLVLWGYSTIAYTRFDEARASLASQSPDALIVDMCGIPRGKRDRAPAQLTPLPYAETPIPAGR